MHWKLNLWWQGRKRSVCDEKRKEESALQSMHGDSLVRNKDFSAKYLDLDACLGDRNHSLMFSLEVSGAFSSFEHLKRKSSWIFGAIM